MSEMQQRNWRVRFMVNASLSEYFDLEISDNIVLGRGTDSVDTIDLTQLDAHRLGVSKRHAMIRSTLNNLFVIDLGSTNGTLKNGQPIAAGLTSALKSGDLLELGRLRLQVQIIDDRDLAAVPERIVPHPPPKRGTAHAKLPQESDRYFRLTWRWVIEN